MNGMTMVLFYGLFIAAMYFLMIGPKRKKQKEQEKLIQSIQSGDDIVTNSGIFGTVTNVKEDRFVVRIADNTKIELAKGYGFANLEHQVPVVPETIFQSGSVGKQFTATLVKVADKRVASGKDFDASGQLTTEAVRLLGESDAKTHADARMRALGVVRKAAT